MRTCGVIHESISFLMDAIHVTKNCSSAQELKKYSDLAPGRVLSLLPQKREDPENEIEDIPCCADYA